MVTAPPPSAASSHWRLLAALLRPHRGVVVVLGLVLAVSAALPLAGPQLLRAFIDAAAEGAGASLLVSIAIGYVGLGVVSQAAAVVTAYVATRLAWSATNRLRERAAAHALRLDLRFHGEHPPGAVVERVDGDATAITSFFTDFVIRVVGAGATLTGAVLLVAREDLRVGLAMGVFCALALFVAGRLRDRAVPQTTEERAVWARWQGLITEHLDGAEDLRGFGARDHALAQHQQAAARQLAASLGAERAGVAIWSWMAGFFAVGGGLMLLAGWVLLDAGTITLGTVLLLFTYTQVIRQPVEQLADQLKEVQRAAAGAARISQLLAEVPAVDGGGAAALPAGALALRIDDVHFAYRGAPVQGGDSPPGGWTLEGVDLVVPAGTVLGLVGTSGSGKTTLARLALRLVEPAHGRVLVGGIDLRRVDRASLRRRVTAVTQDVQLLEGTVRDNLTLYGAAPADHRCPDARLTALLEELGLGRWLAALPAGLATPLGASGATLSAGEAQLLGLGRAFLADPGLVVLDEASSRVDPVSAAVVEEALDRLLDGRTAVVIAHRLRAVDRADTVAVLEAGRVVEVGPRAVLAADATSRFAALLQREREEVRA
jgi:ATP-binding cassette, subfamily B, bacterial